MLEQWERDRYWQIIEDCLVELHGLTRQDAAARCEDRRRRLGEGRNEEDDLFYHNEELYVANALAGHDLDDSKVDAAYRAICARYWPEFYAGVAAARLT